jgi:hypothetical protein
MGGRSLMIGLPGDRNLAGPRLDVVDIVLQQGAIAFGQENTDPLVEIAWSLYTEKIVSPVVHFLVGTTLDLLSWLIVIECNIGTSLSSSSPKSETSSLSCKYPLFFPHKI